MKSFFKNIFLLAIVLALSYFAAEYFGSVYDKFVPQYEDSILSTPKPIIIFITGLPFAYIFFLIFIFSIFGSKHKNKWVTVLLIPPALIWLLADFRHIYFPIIFALIAFALARLVRFIIIKFRRPNPPMVV